MKSRTVNVIPLVPKCYGQNCLLPKVKKMVLKLCKIVSNVLN